MDLTSELISVYRQTANALNGVERRVFMATVVRLLGEGGQRQAEAELGWNRGTIRRGMRELQTGLQTRPNYRQRGRKRIEERLPNLLSDIATIIDGKPISAARVRQQLIRRKGYQDRELPTVETIRKKIRLVQAQPGRM